MLIIDLIRAVYHPIRNKNVILLRSTRIPKIKTNKILLFPITNLIRNNLTLNNKINNLMTRKINQTIKWNNSTNTLVINWTILTLVTMTNLKEIKEKNTKHKLSKISMRKHKFYIKDLKNVIKHKAKNIIIRNLLGSYLVHFTDRTWIDKINFSFITDYFSRTSLKLYYNSLNI